LAELYSIGDAAIAVNGAAVLGSAPGTKLELITTKHLKELPRPLTREIAPPEPFPVEALGDILCPAALAIHDRVRAPLAMCAQSVLAAAALASQGVANITLPAGQVCPLSLYLLTIAESGERKSSVDNEALYPIAQFEDELRGKYADVKPKYDNAKEAWEKARDAAVKAAKGNRAHIEDALNKLGKVPVEPLFPMITCGEPTWKAW
jgi:hypothetical protein